MTLLRRGSVAHALGLDGLLGRGDGGSDVTGVSLARREQVSRFLVLLDEITAAAAPCLDGWKIVCQYA